MIKVVAINYKVDSTFIHHLSNPWELKMKSQEAELFAQRP